MESLLDQIEETGQYVEDNALEILQASKDEGTRKLTVRFAHHGQRFFSVFDLNRMPMGQAGIALESLQYIATKSSETSGRNWALGQTSRMVEGWQDRITTKDLLWPAAV